jgi:anti-sigma B factor antagonist
MHPVHPTRRFEISFESQNGTTVLAVSGEIDIATAPQLERSLVAAEQDHSNGLVLDLTGVGFLDSSALHVLLRSTERLDERGRQLHVVCTPGPVKRLFELTVLTTTFDMHASRGAAILAAANH